MQYIKPHIAEMTARSLEIVPFLYSRKLQPTDMMPVETIVIKSTISARSMNGTPQTLMSIPNMNSIKLNTYNGICTSLTLRLSFAA